MPAWRDPYLLPFAMGFAAAALSAALLVLRTLAG
jgi:hypothetical protein